MLQSATNSVETLRPIGVSDVLLTSKGGKKLFLPHPLHVILCRCSSYLQKTTNNPTLNGGEGCGFFCSLKLPYLSTMSRLFCRRLQRTEDERFFCEQLLAFAVLIPSSSQSFTCKKMGGAATSICQRKSPGAEIILAHYHGTVEQCGRVQ